MTRDERLARIIAWYLRRQSRKAYARGELGRGADLMWAVAYVERE